MIASDRNLFIGFHVTKALRDRIVQEAKKQTKLRGYSVSVSRIVYEYLLKAFNLTEGL